MRRDDRVVFVHIAPGELERRVVHVGSELGDHVQVLDGLREGENVVVENAVLLDGELDLVL
jgi:cobalt-zinc-cadmium efflux system membrane fusion protein